MISQTSRRNAIYTVGISTILISAASGYTVTLYDSNSGGNTIASNIGSTGVLVDVSNYNVIYTSGSTAAVVTNITVKS